jgi:hypothetical protein
MGISCAINCTHLDKSRRSSVRQAFRLRDLRMPRQPGSCALDEVARCARRSSTTTHAEGSKTWPAIWLKRKRTGSRAYWNLPQLVHHFHSVKCFGANYFGDYGLVFVHRKSNLPAEERAHDLQETRQRELRTVSGRLLQRTVLEEDGKRGLSSRDPTDFGIALLWSGIRTRSSKNRRRGRPISRERSPFCFVRSCFFLPDCSPDKFSNSN